MSRTLYKAGVFEMPSTGGGYTVTTGFRPRGVTFFGINTDQVDTVVTSSPRGLFMGQMGEQWDDPGTLVSYAVAMMSNVNSKAKVGACILMSDAACNTQYEAVPASFNATGFTINVTHAATSTRYIHWWAWGGANIHSGSYFARTPGSPSPNVTLGIGFKFRSAEALLYHPAGSDEVCNFTALYHGTTHWPADVSPVYSRSGMSGASRLGLGDQGYVENWCFSENVGGPNVGAVVEVLDAVGPFVNSGFRYMKQSGTTDLELTGGGSSFYEMHSWWDGEGWTEMQTPAAGTDGVALYPNANPNFDKVAFAAVSHVSGPNANGEFAGDGRFGYGVITKAHQSCCVVAGVAGKMYQSLDKVAAKVDTTGLHTAEGTLAGNALQLTTVDSGTAPSNLVAHMYGPPAGGWVPQVYRRRIS